jgi:hypothetical protein
MLERRRIEDDAPRLLTEVPNLKKLKIELSARRDELLVADSTYVRHIMVDSAPALIWIPCGDARCTERHDITNELLRGLRSKQTRITGTIACRGQVGSAECARVLHYTAVAEYS